MTTTQDLSTLSPSEIDTILFPLWAKRYRTAQHLMQYLGMSDRQRGFNAEQAIADLRAELDEIAVAIAPLNAEFDRRGGWSRYDFVPDGHLHYYGCHTLRPTTVRLLVADASGQDAAWIVEHFAYAACTYCFPEAPVEARETYLREQKDAKAAERQAKADVKAAKAAEKNLVSPLLFTTNGYREHIETVYAAKQWLKRYCEWMVWKDGHPSYPESVAEIVRDALGRKGIDTAPLEVKWTKAAGK